MSKRITLIIGAVLSILSVILVKVYLDQQRAGVDSIVKRKLEKERQNLSTVFVAKRDIRKGTPIDSGMIATEIIPNQYVRPQAVNSSDRIVGLTAAVDIPAKEQISKAMLIAAQEAVSAEPSLSLAMAIPSGKRAVAVPVDPISSVAGLIRPGNYVDIIVMAQIPVQEADGKDSTQSASLPVLQNVLVLSVGQDMGVDESRMRGRSSKEGKKQEQFNIVTLALSPQETSIVSFVIDQGAKLRLVLRSPSDAQIQIVAPTNWETLFQYAMPQMIKGRSQPIKEDVPEEPPKHKVEIYHGFQKEDLYLTQPKK